MRSSHPASLCRLVLALSTIGAVGALAQVGPSRTGTAAGAGQELAGAPTCLPCESTWQSLFGAYQGFDDLVVASEVFDDGSGPALYFAGAFHVAGSQAIDFVVRWDGDTWSPLGAGLDGTVEALAVHDDGDGPDLYAAGVFSTAGGQPASRIARWDGSSWSSVGAGLNGTVLALASHDDGSGPRLFAGGEFTASGAVPAARLAAWDGSAWAQVGDGLNNRVQTLCRYDSGSGAQLILSGNFSATGFTALPGFIAAWDGAALAPLGLGLSQRADAMVVHDDGSGSRLWVSGGFGGAGGMSGANGYATWDGSSWALLPSTPSGGADVLFEFDTGTQTVLVAGGDFALPSYGTALWNGTGWVSMVTLGLSNGPVLTLASFEVGGEQRLVAAGGFNVLGNGSFDLENVIGRVATWDTLSWHPVESGLMGSHTATAVRAATMFDDGSGPALFVGGLYTKVADQLFGNLLRWDGTTLDDLGGGVSFAAFGQTAEVTDMVVHDDGSGSALYVCGRFDRAGGVPAKGVARWDGSGWSALGAGLNSPVMALASYDDGTGAQLYAGDLDEFGGGYVVRWDGSSWNSLPADVNAAVRDLQVHDDGSGPKLFVAGSFDLAGGQPVDQVAAFDGSSWSAVGTAGTGPDGQIQSLAVADLGAGPELVVGGLFDLSGDHGVGRWDGTTWSPMPGLPLGSNQLAPQEFAVWDAGDGAGAELYAGGIFKPIAGPGTPRGMLARWTGSTWDVLEDFIDPATESPTVHALASYDLGFGPELLVGGTFLVSPGGDSYVTRLVGCGPPSAWCDVGFALAGTAGPPVLEGSGSLASGSANLVVLSQAAPASIAGMFLSLSSAPVPFKGGTLVPVPFLVDPVVVPTSPEGVISVPFVMPGGAPAGTELWVQWAVLDGGAPNGLALSNALLGLTP